MRKIGRDDIDATAPLAYPLHDVNGRCVLEAGSVPAANANWPRWLNGGLYVDVGLLWRQAPCGARQCVQHAIVRLTELKQAPVENSRAFADEMTAIAALVSEAWRRDSDVMTATVMLCRDGDQAARQAVYTACVALRVLCCMDMPEAHGASVLAAALSLHLEQPLPARPLGRLGALLPRAGVDGVSGLRRRGVRDPVWLDTVRQAKRILNEDDQPLRLRDKQLSDEAQLIALADLLCASLDETGSRQAGASRAVLRDVLIEHGAHVDIRIASSLIRALGVYPVGTVVQLARGEIGVVSDLSEQLDAPWVCSLFGELGAPLAEPVLRDTRQGGNAIRESLSAMELPSPVNMAIIWGEEAADYRMPSGLLHGERQSV
ncbi:hypothetical protein FNU76_21750 [Chitinimonas arctica]|uniref:Uncharacterized protein n=1 Tax=Chitinimonas arctica TaxID=2594795 RepID=A0A516SKW4_9NEIS|nr:hypothetical protein [Chitinimonas arctica]QDQ28763.1 hypothetical protein FNU76_21750 [Chitinimonas arctica]